MLDFQEFQELNEAFNSEPYGSTHITSDTTRERYTFSEDANHNYRIEVAASNKLGLPPFGTKTRVVRIGFNTSNSSVYRPVVTRFKDPRRVIATILGIINNYKTDGLRGSQIQGFAIMIDASLFGSYGAMFRRIAKMYLRQQFDVSDSEYTPVEDANFVWTVRKGKRFSDVFNGAGITQDVGERVSASSDAAQPNDVMSTLASIQPAEDKTGHWLVRYDLLGGVSDTDAMQIVGVTTRSYGDVYTLQLYNKFGGSLGQVVQSANDIDGNIWQDIGTEAPAWEELPSNSAEQGHRFDVGDIIAKPSAEMYAKVLEIVGSDYIVQTFVKANNQVIDQRIDFPIETVDSAFEPYTPIETPQPIFSVGQNVSRVTPTLSVYYYEIWDIVVSPADGGEPYYRLYAYKKATRRRNRGNDGILKFSIIHERYDAYNPRTGEFYNQNPNLQSAQQNVTTPAPAATPAATPAEQTLFDYSLLVNRPVVSRQISSFSEITSTGWYYAQIPSAGSAFLFLQAVGNNYTTERRYKVDGDIYDDGELNRYEWKEGTVYHRLDRPPVFKKTSYPHRYNVGDSVNYNGDVQKVLGFRGKFYILDREENFVMISSVDASATPDTTTAPTQSSQPAFPAKTREEHMADFAKAKDEYGVVVGESVVDYMIRYCPAATVYDICKAMFGEPNTDTGDGRKIWLNGDTITASQNGGSIHGAPLQRLTRQFKFGESYVYHDYLMMKPSSQGGGATKKLFTESIPLYEKMGFKKVKVYANIDVGAAIWSRYGFKSYETMDQSSWDRFLSNRISQVKNLERSISRLDEFDSLHQAELQGVINLLEGFKQSGYFSDYPAMVCSLTVPNVEALFQEQLRQYCSGAKPNLKLNIGKMLMWGNGYRGELDLSDRKSYNRMARYVGLPTR